MADQFLRGMGGRFCADGLATLPLKAEWPSGKMMAIDKFNLATNGNTTDAPRCMLYFSASSSYPARLKFRTIEKQGYQAHTTRDERRPVLKSPPNALT
jgi:hypothetical protein